MEKIDKVNIVLPLEYSHKQNMCAGHSMWEGERMWEQLAALDFSSKQNLPTEWKYKKISNQAVYIKKAIEIHLTRNIKIMSTLAGFKLWSQYWDHPFGSFFKGTYLPQNRVLVLAPHLETERKPFQKHIHSLLLELLLLSLNSPLGQR